MNEKREPIISRTYGKGTDTVQLFVTRISGGAIDGTVFQYEVHLNNQEQLPKPLPSGNKYEIRKKWTNGLHDLVEDGWKYKGGATYDTAEAKFFDTESL